MNKLQQLQALDLDTKIMKTKARIREWHYHFGGQVYVAFSGGKDSTVLLDLVRQEFPEVPAVFVNTGLEYPEIVEFVKTVDNVTELKPKMDFVSVIKKYGYPVISKEQSKRIYYAKRSERKQRERYIGTNKSNTSFKLSKKWYPFLESDLKISGYCCDIMKKEPSKRYEKETGRVGFIGTMAHESQMRLSHWNKHKCNSFKTNPPKSKPLSFWLEKDIWEYINKYNLSYSKIYDMGYDRTGCMFCSYGLHMNNTNKFQLMEKTHPKIHKYCIEKLGLGEIVDFMNKNCNCSINLYAGPEQLKLF